MKFISVGFGNLVASDRIVAIISPDSSPAKRLVADAKEDGRVIDASCGRKTKSVIITDSEHIILSSSGLDTLRNRLSDNPVDDEEENI